jgi:glycosyltransferase involved in cell wall biosynthesis
MISIICPVYNESKFIDSIVEFFINSAPVLKELIFIDGGSNDGSIEVIKYYENKYKNIRLINNPDKYVPYALNLGIKNSTGEIIARIDAHCYYSPDYFEQIIQTFHSIDADIVGGPTRIYPEEGFRTAVGFVMSHPFGIGNSKVHSSNYRGYVDHVTFGAWKKNIFQDIGFFDERLIRNQDDEFHYRAKSMGKKIYLNPDIKLWYIPRNSYSGFFQQYFQYGFYKPMVLRKIKSEIKFRHLVPSIFVIYIFLCILFAMFPLILIPLFIYISIIFSITLFTEHSLINKARIPLLFFIIHIAYGTGVICGLFKLNRSNKP